MLVNLQTASMSQTLKGMQDQVGSVHTRSPVCPDLKEKITACLEEELKEYHKKYFISFYYKIAMNFEASIGLFFSTTKDF